MRFLNSVAVLACLLVTSCNPRSRNSAVETAIGHMHDRLSSSGSHGSTRKEPQQLVRSVFNPELGLELQLRREDAGHTQTVIVIDRRNLAYAIPLPGNDARSYWGFEGEMSSEQAGPRRAAFRQELQSCMDRFRLDGHDGKALLLLDEIFVSLLRCKPVSTEDTAASIFISASNTERPDDYDSCVQRLRANWKLIRNRMTIGDKTYIMNTYQDRSNGRIYQLGDLYHRDQWTAYQVRVYRQECVIQALNM